MCIPKLNQSLPLVQRMYAHTLGHWVTCDVCIPKLNQSLPLVQRMYAHTLGHWVTCGVCISKTKSIITISPGHRAKDNPNVRIISICITTFCPMTISWSFDSFSHRVHSWLGGNHSRQMVWSGCIEYCMVIQYST